MAYITYIHYTYLFLVAWAATRDEAMDPSSADGDHGFFWIEAFLLSLLFARLLLHLLYTNQLFDLLFAARVAWLMYGGEDWGQREGRGFFCRYCDTVLREWVGRWDWFYNCPPWLTFEGTQTFTCPCSSKSYPFSCIRLLSYSLTVKLSLALCFTLYDLRVICG